jgi:hypothetical protein
VLFGSVVEIVRPRRVRRIYLNLGEDDCAEAVAKVVKGAGSKLSASRVKRIAKTRENKKAALEWIDEQQGVC